MDRPEIVAAMALAALAGGAAGLRCEGLVHVRAVRAVTDVPIIGLVKRAVSGSDIYITPGAGDIADLADAGADAVAFDATRRPRPEAVAALIDAAHGAGVLAMADCADRDDMRYAAQDGADILSTTLSGYVSGSPPLAPDLALVAAGAVLPKPVFAEGRIRSPADAAAAIAAGAFAVVVGSAITRVEHVTAWFAEAIMASSGC